MRFEKKKKKQQVNPPINPGISLLIVVFLVLCLFTFSAISLTSAINEYERSYILGTNTRLFYEASNRAEREVLAQKERCIQTGAWTIDDIRELSYDIGENQSLEVRLEPLSEPVNDKYFNITRWQVVQKGEWQGDDTLHLYVPE